MSEQGAAAGGIVVLLGLAVAGWWWFNQEPELEYPVERLELSRVRKAGDRPIAGPDGQTLPNFLVIVADDVGQDMVGAYGVHPTPPRTPRIDKLAEQGLMFDHAVSNPVCSPTRATLVTGQYSHRYGLGRAIPPKEGWGLPDTERSVADALTERTHGAYTSVVVGKWHLSTPTMGGYTHPRKMGFRHHVGTMGNIIGNIPGLKGEPQTYDFWSRTIDGVAQPAQGYLTAVTIDDALQLADELPEPWFMLLNMHAAHFPMHRPPRGSYYTPIPPAQPDNDDFNIDTYYYRAMVESMDMEVGRLLDGIDDTVLDRTNVLFLGDNGSAPVGVLPPWERKLQSKGSLKRGGVRVPFIMTGPSVQVGGRTDALINTTDVFATVMELAQLDEPAPQDSISFAPVLADPSLSPRTTAFAERFSPNGMGDKEWWEVAIRDHAHKVIVKDHVVEAVYDLEADDMELENLIDREDLPQDAVDRLIAKLPEAVLPVRMPIRMPDQTPEE